MTVAATSILSRVRTQLVDTDPTNQRWSDAELLNWLSDGERTIVAAVPWAYSVTSVIDLVAGTLQSLPPGANTLIEIIRNVNSDGSVPGAPCTMIDRSILDRQYLNWHLSDNSSPTVLHYTYDENNPLVFYVLPYNNGSGYVQANVSMSPPDHVSTSENIFVLDIFTTALVDYVMFRAHQKDADFAAGQQLATFYLQSFSAFVEQRKGGAR
jgi:hypothetical protein